LSWFYELRGWGQEGVSSFARAAEELSRHDPAAGPWTEEQTVALGLSLAHQGWFLFRQGQFVEAREVLTRSRAVLQDAGDRQALADSILFLAIDQYTMGEYEEARRLTMESLLLSRAIDARWNVAMSLGLLGQIAEAQGDYHAALDWLRQGLAVWRVVGEPRGMTLCLSYLGVVTQRLGELAEAQQFLRESLVISSEAGDRFGIGTSLTHLGLFAHRVGEYHEARYLFLESIALFREIGDRWAMARALSAAGDVAVALGNVAEAQTAYRDAFRLAMAAQTMPVALEALVGQATLLVHEGAHERATELLAHILHHPASTQETRDRAMRLREGLEEEAPSVRDARPGRALQRPFGEVVAEVLGPLGTLPEG
jgi:tetratricopeptide (TPR) repeat protein